MMDRGVVSGMVLAAVFSFGLAGCASSPTGESATAEGEENCRKVPVRTGSRVKQTVCEPAGTGSREREDSR